MAAQEGAVRLVVGRVEEFVAVLTSSDHHVVELPMALLPAGAKKGSVVDLKVSLNEGAEETAQDEMRSLQEHILDWATNKYEAKPATVPKANPAPSAAAANSQGVAGATEKQSSEGQVDKAPREETDETQVSNDDQGVGDATVVDVVEDISQRQFCGVEWRVIRPNDDFLAIDDGLGLVRMRASPGSIWGTLAFRKEAGTFPDPSSATNVLITSDTGESDFRGARVLLRFAPTSHGSQAGLLLYSDERNYVKFVVEKKRSGKVCVVLGTQVDGTPKVRSSVEVPEGPVRLSLGYHPSNGVLHAAYEPAGHSAGDIQVDVDGFVWPTEVNELGYVGITAHGGSSDGDGDWAEFRGFGFMDEPDIEEDEGLEEDREGEGQAAPKEEEQEETSHPQGQGDDSVDGE